MSHLSNEDFTNFESEVIQRKPYNLELAEEKIVELTKKLYGHKTLLSIFGDHFRGQFIMASFDANQYRFDEAMKLVEYHSDEYKKELTDFHAAGTEGLRQHHEDMMKLIEKEVKFYLGMAGDAQSKQDEYRKAMKKVNKAMHRTDNYYKNILKRKLNRFKNYKLLLKILFIVAAFGIAWLFDRSESKVFNADFLTKNSLLILSLYFIADLIVDFFTEKIQYGIRKRTVESTYKKIKEDFEYNKDNFKFEIPEIE